MSQPCRLPVDREGKTVQERFNAIRAEFLARLSAAGLTRTELYGVKKFGSCELTEEALVRHWAGELGVELNDVLVAIQTAFAEAPERGHVVSSFRYVQPHIVRRIQAMAGSRVGR